MTRPVSAMAFLIVLHAIGCAAGTPRATDVGAVPSVRLVLLDGSIADVNMQARTISFKEKNEYSTWTIGVGEDVRIISAEQGLVGLDQLRVGDRLRVGGRSRIPQVMTAEEIWILTGDR